MNHNIRAAALVTLGMSLIASNDVIVKLASEDLSVPQILSLRGALAVGFFVVLLRLARRPIITRVALGRWNIVRALCETGATLCFITGLSLLPIATASTLVWTSPILVTLCAALLLGERVGPARWAAVLVGFAGMLLVTGPWGESFSLPMLLPLGAALFVCAREMVTKKIDPTVRSMHITLATLVTVTLAGTILAYGNWEAVSRQQLGWLTLSAMLLSTGFLCQVSAIRLGDLSFIAPFSFSGILVSVFYGRLIWGDEFSAVMVAGIAMIAAAGLFLVSQRKA